MIIWIVASIVGIGVLVMGFVWTRHDQQDATPLIPALVPVRDSK